jgi:uncharacterized protein YbbK (DUF523 family)
MQQDLISDRTKEDEKAKNKAEFAPLSHAIEACPEVLKGLTPRPYHAIARMDNAERA